MPLGDSTSTSKLSPPSTRFCNWPTVPLSITTLFPVAFSNSGTKATTTCLNAPVVSTLISAATAVCVSANPITAPSRSHLLRRIVSPLPACLKLLKPFIERHHVRNLAERGRPLVDHPLRPRRGGFLQHRGVVWKLPNEKVAAVARIGHAVVAQQSPFLQHQQQTRRVARGVPAIEIVIGIEGADVGIGDPLVGSDLLSDAVIPPHEHLLDRLALVRWRRLA